MAKNFVRNIEPTQRVKDILRLVDKTPLSADLILEGSKTFGTAEKPDPGFTTVRRVREKMQQLASAGLVAERSYTIVGRGVTKFYQITPAGFELLYQVKPDDSHRKFFRETGKLNWEHLYANAKVIMKNLVAAHAAGIRNTTFYRENESTFATGSFSVQPDNVHQFCFGGQFFNCPFEIDRNTETLDGFHPKAWRHRILAYEAYQDFLLSVWKRNGQRFAPPRLRVAFLTTSQEHAYNFLTLASELARNRDRHLFYAATLDEYLQDAKPLTNPILLDHDGRWQALVNLHPSARFKRESVQLPRQKVAPLLAV